MGTILIRNAEIVNEGQRFQGDILIRGQRIERIDSIIDMDADQEINADGLLCLPGIIDDQVHFREPGLDYKATVFTESRAALAGGVTSFMDMPNVKPATLTQELLQQRYDWAATKSAINYSFYMGASNDNLEEVLKTDPETVCGVKVFMGSSTGHMLVDEHRVLESIFSRSEMLIATHSEDEQRIRHRHQLFVERFGDALTAAHHPQIRDHEACYLSSSLAVDLAKKYGTRLHVLHLTTAKEMDLFEKGIPLEKKRITAEVCIHHLFFDDFAYTELGNKLKCNPAVKKAADRVALWNALLEDRLDVIATDHAPHTLDEKSRSYVDAPSGLPLVQHGLLVMMEFYHAGRISVEKIVEKMCHAPAIAFRIRERGFLREGYFADITLIDPNRPFRVLSENILYKCGWSPFEDYLFPATVDTVLVNGAIAFKNGTLGKKSHAMRLEFDR